MVQEHEEKGLEHDVYNNSYMQENHLGQDNYFGRGIDFNRFDQLLFSL